jgi:flavin reductase (DIM6/NTAB) family NADH-FMN oxidoreductase RutF
MLTINPKEVKTVELHAHMLAAVAPRPIAFASTIDKDGKPNLSPFSFFNAFGSNPPILVFSPARRVRDNTIKHTLENVYEVDEVVINVVNYNMVHQQSLASTEYEKGVSEFEKAGFTPIASELVKPFRVKESPVQFECKVKQVIETGTNGGAGNLIVCEILLMHIDESVLNEHGKIDPHKIDLVARMGADYYCRASGSSIFEVAKPLLKKGIGVDQLPTEVRLSPILTGNNLGQLGNFEKLPSAEEVHAFNASAKADYIRKQLHGSDQEKRMQLHQMAKALLEQNSVTEAWELLLME